MDTPAPAESGDASKATESSRDAPGRDLPVAPVSDLGVAAHDIPRAQPDAPPGPAPSTAAPELRVEARQTPELRFSAADQPGLIAGAARERVSPPRISRFILLAACVGVSACLGAAAGTASLLALGRPSVPTAPSPAQSIRLESADDMHALKESVGQLRSHLKSVDASLVTLRSTLNGTSSAAAGQLTKITDLVERINRVQAERAQPERPRSERTQPDRGQNESGQFERTSAERNSVDRTPTERTSADRRTPPGSAGGTAPAPASEPAGANLTGAVGPLAEAKPAPAIVEGWVLRKARDGAALIEGRYGTIEIEPGDYLPGIGRVEEIKREGGRWVVVTPKGLIVSGR
jgi:hypothetical protein